MAPISAPAVWLTTLALSLPDLLAHDSSTSLTVPERSRREGRLFACHSERSEESLLFRAQGKLREASLEWIERFEKGFLDPVVGYFAFTRPSPALPPRRVQPSRWLSRAPRLTKIRSLR